MNIQVRRELPGDEAQIRRVELAAFETSLQADLVDSLREAADPFLSMVAVLEGEIVGHISFSPVTTEPPSPPSAQLSPVAVLPNHQGKGVGSELIRQGLEECPNLGWTAVFLLGDPSYYSRFGFVMATPLGLEYENPMYAPDLQVLELETGALDGFKGTVKFHPVFVEAEHE